MANSQLPANLEAEQTIVGAILLNADLVHEAVAILQPEDFSIESHQRVFRAMAELSNEGISVDTVTLANALEKAKSLKAVGGVAYLSQCMVGVPHTPTIESYCRIVKDKAKLRQVIHAANNAVSRAYEQAEPADEVISDLEGQLIDMVEGKKRVPTLPEIGKDFLDEIQRIRNAPHGLIGYTYGIDLLDQLTTGIREADYTVIAGRPGMGKSATVRLIALANALQGVKVHVFTPEVTERQFFSLLVPLVTPIPFFKIRKPSILDASELRTVMDATDQLMQLPIAIDGTTSIPITELIAKAKLSILRGAQIILVDYMGLVTCKAAKNDFDRANKVSAGLRDLAKSTRVPVIALSQMNRNIEQRTDTRPKLSDLRESGNIEQDAYNVLFVHRPKVEENMPSEDEIIIAKQRFGDVASIPVRFNKSRVCFEQRQ